MRLGSFLKVKHFSKYSMLFSVLTFFIIVLRLFFPYTKQFAILSFTFGMIFTLASIKYGVLKNHKRAKNKVVKFLLIHKLNILIVLLLFFVGYVFAVYSGVFTEDEFEVDEMYLGEKLDRDLVLVSSIVQNLEFVKGEILDYDLDRDLTLSDRLEFLGLWYSYLDLNIALNKYIEDYKNYYKINYFNYPNENLMAFVIFYSSHSSAHLSGIEVIDKLEGCPEMKIFLNEENKELGLVEGTYDIYKELILSTSNTLISFINSNHGKLYGGKIRKIGNDNVDSLFLKSGQNADRLGHLFEDRVELYLDSKMSSYGSANMELWLPVQKGVANTMGNTRLVHRDRNLISLEQSVDLIGVLEPGDILIERKNWYLSNSGIPGFWPHAALYLGSLSEAGDYFDGLNFLEGESFESYVEENFPEVYLDYSNSSLEGYEMRVIEAIAPGVVLQPVEVSTDADYVVALRPRLSREDKLKAVLLAFSHYGKPYDYDFDFATSDALVCSELVYKSYLEDEGKEGLDFDTSINMGRQILTPVDIVKSFDMTYNTPEQQLDFVVFYDGVEEEGVAVERGVEIFRTSWMRPKWSFFQD